ncbi:MAG: hypothetical protein N2044_13245, partial [Cyclobacteriaceae bacterium]|nr:hypothetical protein [Cyclobacteriaceae bacterium]
IEAILFNCRQRVVCVDSHGTDLIEGKSYVISSIIIDGRKQRIKVMLENKPGKFYWQGRFISYDEEIDIEKQIRKMLL